MIWCFILRYDSHALRLYNCYGFKGLNNSLNGQIVFVLDLRDLVECFTLQDGGMDPIAY